MYTQMINNELIKKELSEIQCTEQNMKSTGLSTETKEVAIFSTTGIETTKVLDTDRINSTSVTSSGTLTSYIVSSVTENVNSISSTSDGFSTVASIEATTEVFQPAKKYSDVLIPKGNWSLEMTTGDCKTSLKLPVTKVIVRETVTDNCNNYSDCEQLVLNIQHKEMERYTRDIQSNFLITGDGLIFEGLSWKCKVEDENTQSTAIWISLTGNSLNFLYLKNYINHRQYDSLKLFLTENQINGNLSPSYELIPYCCINSGFNPDKTVYIDLMVFENFYGEDCLKYYRCNY